MISDKEKISQYITNLFVREDGALAEARENLSAKGLPAISIQPEEGHFLQILVQASCTQKALEIGTLGGYSGIWIARGLGSGGQLITLELEPHHAEVAMEHFTAAGVSDRVKIIVGNAHKILQTLENESPFDFVFIDAEKTGYPAYFDWATEHVSLGGIITAHNVLRGGKVTSLDRTDENTKAMHDFNQKVAQDSHVNSTIYPAGDGMLVAVRIA
jgi:caffeoyl-CoA O-methyltransferase